MLVGEGFKMNSITAQDKRSFNDIVIHQNVNPDLPPNTPNMTSSMGITNLIGAHSTYS